MVVEEWVVGGIDDPHEALEQVVYWFLAKKWKLVNGYGRTDQQRPMDWRTNQQTNTPSYK